MQPSNPHENRAPTLVSQTHYCVMGDVTVAADALIAPGVVLQASPGSRIVVAAGACLAGGVCIQSRKGVLTIGVGANLGANVLVVGNGTVGDYACVSAGSTLMNPKVASESLVSPSTLVVSKSDKTVSPNAENRVTISQQSDSFVNTFVEPPPIGPRPIETPSLSDQNGQYVDSSVQSNGVQLNNGSNNGAAHQGSHSQNGHSSAITVAGNQHVYGKDQINQLLSTLFPNRAP